MKETIDTLLDKDGNVVTDAKLAYEMRRVVLEDGKVVQHSVWFNTRYQKPEEPRTS